jgi:hypothetical protein
MDKKLTKLDALRILSTAHWSTVKQYVRGTSYGDDDASIILRDKFHHVRRSMTLLDLKPEPEVTEGFNGKGPQYF